LDRIDAGMLGKKRGSYKADGMGRHDEKEATRLLEDAFHRLGVRVEDIWRLRQSDRVKQAIAWWIKSRTVVGDEWICRKLEMGHRINVCRAVSRFRKAEDDETRKIKKLLLCAD
jgi:hypothetical protein